jgi:hypothetical protein
MIRKSQNAASALRQCRSFAELHALFEALIGPIHGIGPLAIYDITTRVGAHLGLEPGFVYLGAAKGAKALNLDHRREFLALRPREVEDCLCIYKDDLEALQSVLLSKAAPRAIAPRIRRPPH